MHALQIQFSDQIAVKALSWGTMCKNLCHPYLGSVILHFEPQGIAKANHGKNIGTALQKTGANHCTIQ